MSVKSEVVCPVGVYSYHYLYLFVCLFVQFRQEDEGTDSSVTESEQIPQ